MCTAHIFKVAYMRLYAIPSPCIHRNTTHRVEVKDGFYIVNKARQNRILPSGGEPPGARGAPPINRIEVATA